MQFHIFLLFLFCSSQFFIITTALFHYDQSNSSLNINLYQCNTNKTAVESTTLITSNTIFNSCDLTCCLTNDSNQTTYSNTCQVTAQLSTGVCLGRLCYSGECDQYLPLTNLTYYQKIVNSTAFINKIRLSLSSIPWTLFANSTRTKWTLWENENDSSIRYSILIVLLITNISLTLLALFVTIKTIKHAKIIAKKKARRYSLF